MSSDNIIQKIAMGDESYFGKFIELHSNYLFYYALRILKQREAAEEIVSDVFYEVWKRRDHLLEIKNMKSWLLVITHRKSLSFLRKDVDKRQTLSFDEFEDFHIPSFQTPDKAMISKEEIEKINQAIEQLPPRCKQVFYLAKIEKLPYLEIAEILDISVKTINNHIAHALACIAEKIEVFEKNA